MRKALIGCDRRCDVRRHTADWYPSRLNVLIRIHVHRGRGSCNRLHFFGDIVKLLADQSSVRKIRRHVSFAQLLVLLSQNDILFSCLVKFIPQLKRGRKSDAKYQVSNNRGSQSSWSG